MNLVTIVFGILFLLSSKTEASSSASVPFGMHPKKALQFARTLKTPEFLLFPHPAMLSQKTLQEYINVSKELSAKIQFAKRVLSRDATHLPSSDNVQAAIFTLNESYEKILLFSHRLEREISELKESSRNLYAQTNMLSAALAQARERLQKVKDLFGSEDIVASALETRIQGLQTELEVTKKLHSEVIAKLDKFCTLEFSTGA